MRRLALVSVVLAFFAACGDISLDPLPFEVDLEASHSIAAPGDTINFVLSAQGGNLVGVDTDFGDGNSEQVAMGGARTARVTFRHAYESPGPYQVRATVTDVVAGQKDASVVVNVQ